jgi:hypothetical protein
MLITVIGSPREDLTADRQPSASRRPKLRTGRDELEPAGRGRSSRPVVNPDCGAGDRGSYSLVGCAAARWPAKRLRIPVPSRSNVRRQAPQMTLRKLWLAMAANSRPTASAMILYERLSRNSSCLMDAPWLADMRTVSASGLGPEIGPANATQAVRGAQAAVFMRVASRSVCFGRARVERLVRPRQVSAWLLRPSRREPGADALIVSGSHFNVRRLLAAAVLPFAWAFSSHTRAAAGSRTTPRPSA